MSDRDKPFTINDRRHFTTEGRARPESGVPHADPDPASPPSPPEGATGAAEKERAAAVGPPGPVDFAQFLLSLGAQAGALLSGAEGGESVGAEALEGGRQLISILEMLKDKTEGRRTDGESALLDNLLFQLRLAYVERARRP